jgi:hypothetical protein
VKESVLEVSLNSRDAVAIQRIRKISPSRKKF